MTEVVLDKGSFRDPSGQVYLLGDKVYRTVMPRASGDFDTVRSSEAWAALQEEGKVLPEERVDSSILGEAARDAVYVLEHPKLPYISYPYEWSFPLLKAAALLHLDVHMQALEGGITLSDASAYNIQFIGPKAVFMDHLSFRPYREGEFWIGHRQFCEQFLNPLLLRSLLGIPHNAWYRGTQEGISVEDINQLIPLRKKLSWNVLTQITLQARFQRASIGDVKKRKTPVKQKLPKEAFMQMLKSLHSWIGKMEPADTGKTVWGDYAHSHSYTDEEVSRKKQFIHDFVQARKASRVWDIGCNTGDYSKVAIDAGAELVIGFDFDQKALELAYSRAVQEHLPFLPLFLDAANPSPNQGWAESERKGFSSREKPDLLIALAVVHHLAIGRNVPLDEVVDWLVKLSPSGVIEFVPKNDPMVQELLRLREDIFEDYGEEKFLAALESRARVTRKETVSASGRCLFAFETNTA